MRFQVGLSLILAISVTSAIYGMNQDSSSQDLLVQFSRSNELILTAEKISQLEVRYAKTQGTEKTFIQKLLEEEKQNFYIQNKMMKNDKVRVDSEEEDVLYDAVSSAWQEYAKAEKPISIVQAGVKDGALKLNAYYYSQMTAQMARAHEQAQKRDSLMFGSLILQAMLAGFLAMSLQKPKKKAAHFKVIPISPPKKKSDDSSNKAA